MTITPLLSAQQCGSPSISLVYGSDSLERSVAVGRAATYHVFVVNRGTAPATLGTITNEALGLAPPFALTGGTCQTGGVVPASGDCYLVITFSPVDVGSYSDGIEVRYNWQGSGAPDVVHPFVIDAISAAPIADGPLVNFGSKPLSTATTSRISVSNGSAYDITLGDVSSAGLGLSAPFSRSGGSCTSAGTLAPLTSCYIDVTFTPASVGSFTDALNVAYTWAGGTKSAVSSRPLSGSGVVPLSIAGSSPYFSIGLAGSPQSETFTVTNAAGAVATLGEIASAGLGLGPPFSLTGGTCTSGQVLPPAASCTLVIQFAPASAGTWSERVELPHDLPGAAGLLSSQSIVGSAVSPTAADPSCYETGCPEGHVCWTITSSESGAGTCVEVPPPPPDCMAQCVWEARRKCLPVMDDCQSQYPLGGSASYCDPNTGWAEVRPIFNNRSQVTEHRHHGTACFTERIEFETSGFVFAFYSNGVEPIAGSVISSGADSRTVYCGPFSGPWDLSSVPPPSIPRYTERNTPECADWKATYLGLTACRSSTSGSCGL